MAPNTGLIDEKPVTGGELLAASLIFVLPLFSILGLVGIDIPRWLGYPSLFAVWGMVIFALGLAVIKRLPRWSLPYLGFMLMMGMILGGNYRLWVWIYPLFLNIFGPRYVWALSTRIIYSGIQELFMWLTVLLSALILVNLLRLLPYTRGVWQRIRADWTQLSFLLYGTLVFYIMLTFEEYRYDEVWKFAAWLCLALGAWFYLRAKKQKQRILALMGGATAAMWIIIIAKWILIPYQKWPDGYPIAPSEITRWNEVGYTTIGWVGIMLMMLAPSLLNLLPSKPNSQVQEEIAPA